MKILSSSHDDPNYELHSVSGAERALLLAIRKLGPQGDHLVRGLATLMESRPPIPRPAVTVAHGHDLVNSGAMTDSELERAREQIAGGALPLLEARGWLSDAWDTLSLDATAKFLDRTPEDVLEAVAGGALLSVEVGSEMRLPTWQFTTRPVGHVLPYLAELLPELLKRWKPRTIGRFFVTRQEDLVGEGMKTPAAWLEDGGDPSEILDILAAEAYR